MVVSSVFFLVTIVSGLLGFVIIQGSVAIIPQYMAIGFALFSAVAFFSERTGAPEDLLDYDAE